MKLGAYDFLPKPVDATRLKTILANATRQRETAIELEVARRRLRETGVLGRLVGSSPADAGDLRADRADCAVERSGADHRRERHGQGTGGAHAARPEPAQVAALCGGELRGDSRHADRERDLRPRERRLHGRDRAAGRLLRAGLGRHAAAGRSGRDAVRHAGQAAARAGGAQAAAAGSAHGAGGGRARAGGHQSRSPRRPSPRGICAPTSFTGSMSSTFTCRRCATTWTTCRPWWRPW